MTEKTHLTELDKFLTQVEALCERGGGGTIPMPAFVSALRELESRIRLLEEMHDVQNP